MRPKTHHPSFKALVKFLGLTVEGFQSIQTHDDPMAAELVRKGLTEGLGAIMGGTDIVDGEV